ncbi:MAG TPA: AMP-binding protein, partial [Nitrosarchaeum sp.]|nr:AMP-binding protein [Nitrosarchaeum sp.]
MSDFAFIPTEKQIQTSNIYKFMKKYSISSLQELSQKANQNPEWFWQEVSDEIGIIWDAPYAKILDTTKGIQWSRWFVNGKTNIYKSSVEKFAQEKPDKIAYCFVSEDGTNYNMTYSELDHKVSKLANGLKQLGVKKGDVVAIYLPMIEESILAILASAKIGAIQTVVFSGYSSESLQIRLQDCNAKVLFVCDGFQRKGKSISQKQIITAAIKDTKIEKIIVIPYKGIDVYEESDKVVFYKQLIQSQNSVCSTEIVDSEDSLFILYTSGTTGKPKGVVHTHGGFSVFAGYQAAFLIDM